MKKGIAGLAFAVLLLMNFQATVSANLDDTKESIKSRYGDYGPVIDVANKLWTKADWDARNTREAATYRHVFGRQGIRVTMDVEYESSRPDAKVTMQRFQLDLPIAVKDFKKYFPEIYQDITGRDTQVFATSELLTRNFNETASPITLGIVTKGPYLGKAAQFYGVWAFNISDGGRLVKDMQYIDQDTLITEFVVERKDPFVVKDLLGQGKGKWKAMENYFQ